MHIHLLLGRIQKDCSLDWKTIIVRAHQTIRGTACSPTTAPKADTTVRFSQLPNS